MSLIIGTGSNLGNKRGHLEKAKKKLTESFFLIAESRVYKSTAVDYTDQPDFYNQVLEFTIPDFSVDKIMKRLFSIENEMGRIRSVDKGPRIIDLDVLFLGDKKIKTSFATIPHPRLFERSFVVLPLSELPCFDKLKYSFNFPKIFHNHAFAINQENW